MRGKKILVAVDTILFRWNTDSRKSGSGSDRLDVLRDRPFSVQSGFDCSHRNRATMWKNFTCVDEFLNRTFHKLGFVVGQHPGYFVVIPVLVAFICFTGYQRIHYEIDPEYLFSPTNGPSKVERAIVEQYFKVNYSHRFNLGRITRPGRFGHVIITSKDGVDNLLRTAVFDELMQLDNMIRSARATYEGEEFTYEQICARWLDECFTNDILNLRHIIER
ncbi:patched domain-containing protein isoform X5 [Lasioglossum baleicum]|uniref:patched domain-containing protein isoform X5 n=1 Tax=Lasioglossum baleicum TaxID=434251 RepID=UPI003FCD37C1